MSHLLALEEISKNYEGAPLLRAISFEVAAGEIVCLLGPSGTGKTTLLRILAGLEEADGGDVLLEGKSLRGVPPHERGFGFMFQDLALFPHRNVFENVAFGLRMKNLPPQEIATRVHETLELVGLDATRFAARDVNRLSGGEQQRVALARTLAPQPRLVMFDEPLGALDRILRQELVDELRALLKRLHMTALYVTHDQDEAFGLADRVLILQRGRIVQGDAPVDLFNQPANDFVARFLGLTNLVEIERIEQRGSKARAATAAGAFSIPKEHAPPNARYVLLRPRAPERIAPASARRENVLRGRVVETQLRGGHPHIVLEMPAGAFTFEWDGETPPGGEIVLELNEGAIQFLSGEEEAE